MEVRLDVLTHPQKVDNHNGKLYIYRVSSIFYHQLLADGVVILHLLFILFVVLGGIMTLVWPKVIWVHIPCVFWAIIIELTGMICPLTPLENELRSRAGQGVYSGDFVIHYLEPLIYLEGLTRQLQIILGVMAALINMIVYSWIYLRWKQRGLKN
jgi:hypothetical protein